VERQKKKEREFARRLFISQKTIMRFNTRLLDQKKIIQKRQQWQLKTVILSQKSKYANGESKKRVLRSMKRQLILPKLD